MVSSAIQNLTRCLSIQLDIFSRVIDEYLKVYWSIFIALIEEEICNSYYFCSECVKDTVNLISGVDILLWLTKIENYYVNV